MSAFGPVRVYARRVLEGAMRGRYGLALVLLVVTIIAMAFAADTSSGACSPSESSALRSS